MIQSTPSLLDKMVREAPDKEFVLNEIVLATVPGYAPWPACIVAIEGETLKVQFFGTGEV